MENKKLNNKIFKNDFVISDFEILNFCHSGWSARLPARQEAEIRNPNNALIKNRFPLLPTVGRFAGMTF
jgi:hypothetical protein